MEVDGDDNGIVIKEYYEVLLVLRSEYFVLQILVAIS